MTTKNNIQDLSFKNNKFAYFLAYASFGIANPTFQQYELFPIALLAFLLLIFLFRKESFDKLFFFVIIAIFIVLAAQAIKFGNFTFRSFAGRYLVWLIPYFILRFVRLRYFIFFVNTLFIFSVIGLLFWLIVNLSPKIYNELYNFVELLGTDPDSGQSFIIYNLDYHRPTDIFFMKNPGPFNEGGMYACYLIPAIVFNTYYSGKLWNTKNIVFIISLLTTTSTAGYIALFLFIVVYYLTDKSRSSKFIILPFAILLSLYAFINLPFLSTKISKQFEEQSEMELGDEPRIGRFYSARVGLQLIKENPVFGIGLYREDRFLSKEEEEIGISGSTNGIIDFATKYGLIIWLIYFSAMYLSIKGLSSHYISNLSSPFLYMLPIIAVGSAQDPFNSPVYIILVYMAYYWKKSDLGTTKDGTGKRKEVQLTPELK